MVIAASLLIHKAISPINRLLANWSDIVAARQAYEYLNTLLFEDEAAGLQMKLPAPAGRLVVTDAAAVAPGATSVAITGLNFTVEPAVPLQSSVPARPASPVSQGCSPASGSRRAVLCASMRGDF